MKSYLKPHRVARRFRYLPAAFREFADWPYFMANYAFGRVPERPYHLRRGPTLAIRDGIDHMPIVEVFFRHEYGPVRDGSTVIDVGASTGVFAVYALATAREVSVYAFEPNPASFSVLRQNVTANAAFGRIQAFNCALAASSGSRQLYLDNTDFLYPTFMRPTRGDAARSASVPALTLSDVIEANSIRRVDLLKMDCEGAEYEILFETPMAMLARVCEIRMEYHELTGPERGRAALERFLGQAGFAVTHVEPKPMAGNGILWARRADGGACRAAAGA